MKRRSEKELELHRRTKNLLGYVKTLANTEIESNKEEIREAIANLLERINRNAQELGCVVVEPEDHELSNDNPNHPDNHKLLKMIPMKHHNRVKRIVNKTNRSSKTHLVQLSNPYYVRLDGKVTDTIEVSSFPTAVKIIASAEKGGL